MRINTKCSIALHCLIVIHECEGRQKVTSELLAQSTGCNPAAIRSILSALQKAGIITTTRGVGGAVMNVSPEDLTVWRVYSAVEPDKLGQFIAMHPRPSEECPVGCRIHSVLDRSYQGIIDSVRKTMEETTLKNILDIFYEDLNSSDK